MTKNKKSLERKEALIRILVLIISGIILGLWKALIIFLAFIHWIVVLIKGKRNKKVAIFCEYFNTEMYKFIRYLTFVSNMKPFPFTKAEKLSRFE
ncbi:MAG TPA: DUF4389 domain-containing protein [Candidatus Paceibacterota bacterium]|nr:DUF4389 domain-containing protein [Candidatus Paceibacterota bacterium]